MNQEQIDEIALKILMDISPACKVLADEVEVQEFAHRLVAEIQARNEPVAWMLEEGNGQRWVEVLQISPAYNIPLYTLPPDCEELRKDAERYKTAWEAACGFIYSHAADPDITKDMAEKYAVFMRHRNAIDKENGK